jgi:peptidoglycan hydrolase CwlO-like protein
MKFNSLLVFAFLFSAPVFSQSLPDEINYAPYETRYQNLLRDTSLAQTQLNASRDDLAEAQRFIREMSAHISTLQSQIQQSHSEISRLRREIPELERQISQLRSDDSRVQSDLRVRQNEESQLISRYQDAQRSLGPLESQLARKEQRLRELQNELSQHQRFERDAELRLSREVSQAQTIDRQFEQERNQQRQLEQDLRGIDSRISSVQSDISRLEGEAGSLNSKLGTERAKLEALNTRVSDFQNEVARLRAAGAPAAEITLAERKLSAVRGTRDNTAQEIRNLEGQVTRNDSQIRTFKNQIAELRRSQQSLPGRISQSQSRQRQLTQQRAQVQNDINRFQNELQQARRNIQLHLSAVDAQRQDIRNDEISVLRQRQLVENIGRQVESVRSEISNLTQRSRNLNAQMAQASETARSYQAAIPNLEEGIRSDEQEISEGQRDLVTARSDERTFTTAVAQDESRLKELTLARDTARNERDQRLALYNNYMTEAENLGANQAGQGEVLGKKEGERLSGVLSLQNGKAVGEELGLAQAQLWGSVRGEITGYDEGYAEGLVSAEDRTRAEVEASAKASLDAELFAQTNYKPAFFEEYVLEEFKKPFKVLPGIKSLKSKALSLSKEQALDTIPPLSPNEIAQSEALVTPLDGIIIKFAKDVKLIEAKAKQLRNPSVTFESPVKIPHGTVNCSNVYKGLAVFKAACEGSYKGSFTNNYINGAKEAYSAVYPDQFTSQFNSSNVSKRESHFAQELDKAFKVSHAEGLRIGKIEIYQRTYESSYSAVYKTELVKARTKAKDDAAAELKDFLKNSPLLTIASSALSADYFRGGEEITIVGKVKNIGMKALSGPVIVRLTEVINAETVLGEAVLNSAAALSLTDLPTLKVKALATAKAGEKVIVKGMVDLPGDLYRPARQEAFELRQILSANPAHGLELDYNKFPSIKGIFRRNIHFLSVSLTPELENIKDGYQLTLSALAEGQALMDIREGEFSTGPLAVGEAKEARFSYVFNDAAKGKNIKLELKVSYLGKVIKTSVVELIPR